jgi:PKD repeat protein
MENQLNKFDQLVKDTYESHEFPFDPQAWDEMEEELNATAPGILDYFKSITTGLAITGVIFASMLIYFSNNGDQPVPEKQEVSNSEIGMVSEELTVEEETENKTDDLGKTLSNEETSDLEAAEVESEETSEINEGKQTTNTAQKTASQESEVVTASVTPAADEAEDGKSIRKGCTGLTIQFDAPEEYGKDAKYLWNFGDGYFSNEANPTHTFNKEGVFDVSLSVTSLSSGQISSNVVQAMIEVEDAPDAGVNIEIASKDLISLSSSSLNATRTSWNVNGKEESEESEISLSLVDNTKYDVSLIAKSNGACIDTLNKKIHVVKAGNQFPKIYMSNYPSSYSPGAIVDNGEVIDFRVFEKSSGEEIYRSSGPKGWDGKLENGDQAEKGEYTWVMMVDSDETIDIYRGEVNLQ